MVDSDNVYPSQGVAGLVQSVHEDADMRDNVDFSASGGGGDSYAQ